MLGRMMVLMSLGMLLAVSPPRQALAQPPKPSPPKISRTHKPDGVALEDWQRALRRQPRGRADDHRVTRRAQAPRQVMQRSRSGRQRALLDQRAQQPERVEQVAVQRQGLDTDATPPGPVRKQGIVVRTRPETHDTFTLTLAPVAAGAPFTFEAGQFNMLFAPGVGEAAISMSGCAGTLDQVVHTIRAAGRVTKTLRSLKRGGVLGLRGPFGKPWPVCQAEGHDVLIVAGGIGNSSARTPPRRTSAVTDTWSPVAICRAFQLSGDTATNSR